MVSNQVLNLYLYNCHTRRKPASLKNQKVEIKQPRTETSGLDGSAMSKRYIKIFLRLTALDIPSKLTANNYQPFHAAISQESQGGAKLSRAVERIQPVIIANVTNVIIEHKYQIRLSEY